MTEDRFGKLCGYPIETTYTMFGYFSLGLLDVRYAGPIVMNVRLLNLRGSALFYNRAEEF